MVAQSRSSGFDCTNWLFLSFVHCKERPMLPPQSCHSPWTNPSVCWSWASRGVLCLLEVICCTLNSLTCRLEEWILCMSCNNYFRGILEYTVPYGHRAPEVCIGTMCCQWCGPQSPECALTAIATAAALTGLLCSLPMIRALKTPQNTRWHDRLELFGSTESMIRKIIVVSYAFSLRLECSWF